MRGCVTVKLTSSEESKFKIDFEDEVFDPNRLLEQFLLLIGSIVVVNVLSVHRAVVKELKCIDRFFKLVFYQGTFIEMVEHSTRI